MLTLALVAGVISDRVNRKTWLVILQLVVCVRGAGLAVAAVKGKATPIVVIGFTFLEGIVWALVKAAPKMATPKKKAAIKRATAKPAPTKAPAPAPT